MREGEDRDTVIAERFKYYTVYEGRRGQGYCYSRTPGLNIIQYMREGVERDTVIAELQV